MSITLASIHVYPIKSLGGYAVKEARLTDRGLEHDRRWMLVDENGRFLSQREVPAMACLHVSPNTDGIHVINVRNGGTQDLPWRLNDGPERIVRVWDDIVKAIDADDDRSRWFSAQLGRSVQLVYMPEGSERAVDPTYAEGITAFSDGFPYLIISQASLDDLNQRIPGDATVPMERFRPNLVVAGGAPFQEDAWRTIAIGAVRFELVKPCSRCAITTTDQRTGERGKEPLRTLATYRKAGNEVNFGMNAVGAEVGIIRVGDAISIFGS